jgi:N-methylhydantoinase B
MPAYHEYRLIGYAGSIAHHIDVGGKMAGTESADNTELYQEGLLLPPVKLVERGRRNRAVFDLIRANVRDPTSTMGDLQAQMAACRRGAERLMGMCERNSQATVVEGMRAILEQTSRRAIAEFSSWPQRRVEADGWLDDDGVHPGQPVHVVAALEVRQGSLHIDFTGSSPQLESALNVPWASTHAASYFAVRCFAGEEIPQNDGLTRHIVLHAPEGTVVRPRFPAAVSVRHLTVQRIAEVLCRALGDLLPERATASSHTSFPTFVFQAVDPRTEKVTIFTDILGGGGGARARAPGDNAIDTYTSNCALLPLEIAEMEYPWRIERTELVAGSGGTGAWRGGLGMRRDYRLLAERADGMYYVEQLQAEFTPPGRAGGGSGAPASIRIKPSGGSWRTQKLGKRTLRLKQDDVISFVGAGGGGYGGPAVSR